MNHIRPTLRGRLFTVAARAVEQTAFDAYTADGRDLYRRPLLDTINSMLETLNGWAVIARGTFERSTYRIGERDSTDDIAEMARPDNVWSQCVIFTTGMLIKELIRQGIDVDILDVYHDPKALRGDHADALAQTLRGTVVTLARQFTSERNLPVMKSLNIRRVQAVGKPVNSLPTRCQLGTWVADRLCALAFKNRSRGYSRIIHRDMSEIVRRTVQQFEGKPFHSD